MKVAIVEREKLGGICLNWGCIPTKALLRTSEINHYLTHASAYGLVAEKPSFDLAKIVDRSRKVAGQLNGGVKGLMKKNKVAVHEGDGAIVAKGRLTVTKDGKTTELQAKHIIVATGATRPRPAPSRRRTASASGPTATPWCRPRCRPNSSSSAPARSGSSSPASTATWAPR
jgi:dihydrolipoamide dehydrogenase